MKNGIFKTLICLCACSMMLAGCTTSKDAQQSESVSGNANQVTGEAEPTPTESGVYVRENKLVPADKVEEYLQSHEGAVVISGMLNNSLVQNGDVEVAEGVTEVNEWKATNYVPLSLLKLEM